MIATKRKLNTKPKTLPNWQKEPAFVAHAEAMARALGKDRLARADRAAAG